ncbi:MAG: sigma-70 family RNA polymerase sigma factor [Deltaproteobacteria bacterium]|nr:MAG: sigma-70 family RNA polymerase sigma factor [Deltaproteobacteria bacterium]
MQVYHNLSRFRKRSSLSTWIFRIAINEAKRHFRARKGVEQVGIEAETLAVSPTAERAMIEHQQDRALAAAIERLPEKQRMTVLLRTQQNLSFQEVAAVLGCSVGSARVNFHHAVKRLRRELAGS